MKVYVLIAGCRFRGGEIVNVYNYGKNAIAQGEIMLKEKLKNAKEQGREILYENKWQEVTPEDNVLKAWQSPIEEIIIYEYEVK